MACEADSKRNCFTLIWTLENVNNWCSPQTFTSPAFTMEELANTNWNVELWFPDKYCDSRMYLRNQGLDSIGNLDFEIAFISSDGTVLNSFEEKKTKVNSFIRIGSRELPSWNELFFARRSAFLSQNSLTIRCRMWKSVGEFSKDQQSFARTRIVVEKRSFLWNIENFSTLTSYDSRTYEIKSLGNGTLLMTLQLFLIVGLISDEKIRLRVTSYCENIKNSILQIFTVDASKNTVKCCHNEISFDDDLDGAEFTLFYSKAELMKRKTCNVPNDVLSLKCECYFCFQTFPTENEVAIFDCAITESNVPAAFCYELVDSKSVLIDSLKSMLNNITLSDVKLRTKTQTHFAHKCILSSRSPVFEAMFSNESREKIPDCVDIEDLNDDTVTRMLRYIYSADVEELDFVSATELYEAADKYKILTLKDRSSSYIKNNLCRNNACFALVLADLHQDTDLKNSVQDFILRNGKEIMNSEEWEHFMKFNLKLAAETMHLLCKK